MTESAVNSADLPRSAYLTHTLRRARTAAEQRSHRYVMLEHLLLALLDDPDAQRALAVVNTDSALLRSAMSEAVNHRMATLVSPGNVAPSFSYKFELVMQMAMTDAQSLGRREVDGGLVVIALARDTESFAGSSLRRFGMDPARALRELAGLSAGGSAGPDRRPPAPVPLARAPVAAPSQSQPRVSASAPRPTPVPAPPRRLADAEKVAAAGDASMEDMLASVREMLEVEERKLSKASPPVPAPRQAPLQPQRNGHAPGAAMPPPVTAAPQQQQARSSNGAKSLPVPAADASRRRLQDQVFAGKLVENIPRAMRVAVPEIVELRLSREETAELFEGLQGRGEAQAHDATVTRAMTVRLRAPGGGFFIETLSPETQWIFDRPSFLGGEPFGRWVWTVIPNERGQHKLQVIIASRNIDENGMTGDIALPDQVIDIRVRTNYRRSFAQLFRGVMLLLAGGALTEGALYLARFSLQ
jgi:hypothetical protein